MDITVCFVKKNSRQMLNAEAVLGEVVPFGCQKARLPCPALAIFRSLPKSVYGEFCAF